MPFRVIYKPLAQIEVAQAYAWYAQPEINMGDAFLTELERIDNFLANSPQLYSCFESDIHRANLSRFPYCLFFVIDGDTVNVLSCFHQRRELKTGDQLIASDWFSKK
jgi:hypothetical protein